MHDQPLAQETPDASDAKGSDGPVCARCQECGVDPPTSRANYWPGAAVLDWWTVTYEKEPKRTDGNFRALVATANLIAADERARVVKFVTEHIAWLRDPGRVTSDELTVAVGALQAVLKFCEEASRP